MGSCDRFGSSWCWLRLFLPPSGVKGSLQNIAEPSHTDVPLSLTLLNLPLNAHACLQGMVRGRVGVQPACKAVTGALKERVRRSGVVHTALGVSTHAGGTSYLCGIMLYAARTLYPCGCISGTAGSFTDA